MEQIPDPSEIQLALTGRELGDVRDPPLVRGDRTEVAAQQVRDTTGIRAPTPPLLAGVCADQAVCAHQPGDMGPGDPMPAALQLPEHPRHPIGLA